MSQSDIAAEEVITNPDRVRHFIDTLVMDDKGTHIGSTKPTGFYLWDGKVYGVSIAFHDVTVYDAKTFAEGVKTGKMPGYIPVSFIDRLFAR